MSTQGTFGYESNSPAIGIISQSTYAVVTLLQRIHDLGGHDKDLKKLLREDKESTRFMRNIAFQLMKHRLLEVHVGPSRETSKTSSEYIFGGYSDDPFRFQETLKPYKSKLCSHISVHERGRHYFMAISLEELFPKKVRNFIHFDDLRERCGEIGYDYVPHCLIPNLVRALKIETDQRAFIVHEPLESNTGLIMLTRHESALTEPFVLAGLDNSVCFGPTLGQLQMSDMFIFKVCPRKFDITFIDPKLV